MKLEFVGGEKDQRPAHFLRPAQPADRHLAAELLLHDLVAEAVAVAVEDGRVDEGGMHRVAADVVARLGAVQGHRLAEQPHARLGRVVGRHVGAGDDAGDRRDVDHRAAQPLGVLLDLADAVLAAQEHAVEVDRMHAAPFLERDVLDRLAEPDAGGVEQNVDRAELVDGFGDRGLPVVLAGDVELHEMAGRAQLVGHRLAAVGGDVGDDDPGAFLRHQDGGVGAEARGAAGDQSHLAGQTIGHVFFPPALASRWAI